MLHFTPGRIALVFRRDATLDRNTEVASAIAYDLRDGTRRVEERDSPRIIVAAGPCDLDRLDIVEGFERGFDLSGCGVVVQCAGRLATERKGKAPGLGIGGYRLNFTGRWSTDNSHSPGSTRQATAIERHLTDCLVPSVGEDNQPRISSRTRSGDIDRESNPECFQRRFELCGGCVVSQGAGGRARKC